MDDFGKSRFLDYLLIRNNISVLDFKRWIFSPGMLFRDTETWWPDGRPRSRPHEGVDFHQFVDHNGQIHTLSAKTIIPAMSAGTVIDIFDDFLGKSIVLALDLQVDGYIPHAIYGHVMPAADLRINSRFLEGQILATLAASQKSNIPPHLHLSILLMTRHARTGEIRWQSINDPALGKALGKLCNPLDFCEQ